MQVLTEVVEPNEDNVQRPTETTEEWEAAPGGVTGSISVFPGVTRVVWQI